MRDMPLRPLTRLNPLCPALIVLSGCLVYANSFQGMFLFDDTQNIVLNTQIRSLWPPIGGSLRPWLFLTLRINYAISGLEVWSYHLINLAVHLATALALLGVIRRTFRYQRLPLRTPDWVDRFAAAVATIWVVHPLTTQAVTYVIQRGEVLASLFYVLTLYCLIRATQSPRPAGWYAGVALAFCLSLGSKELALTIPLVILLYDALVVTGRFRDSLRRRWPLYATLMALPVLALLARWLLGLPSWYMFVATYAMLTGRQAVALADGTRGLLPRTPGTSTPLEYLATQPEVLTHYLRLAIWPRPLVFDYGWPGSAGWTRFLWGGAPVWALLAATAWAFRRRPVLCFLGASFFLFLSPSSSVLPLDDMAAEHRMYLPLAIVIAFVAFATETTARNVWTAPARERARLLTAATALIVVAFGTMTVQRNFVYHSTLDVWADVVAKRPLNERGHHNYGTELLGLGRVQEALASFEEAVRINPSYANAQVNIGAALEELGRTSEARRHYVEALRIAPRLAGAHHNLGRILADEGQLGEAMRHYEDAERYVTVSIPYYPMRRDLLAHLYDNMGRVHAALGDPAKARSYYRKSLIENPEFVPALNNLGLLAVSEGTPEQSIRWYERAVEIEPDNAAVHDNMGTALLSLGRTDAALAAYREAVRLDPGHAEFHNDVGVALAGRGEHGAARRSYEEAIRLDPVFARAHNNLGLAWIADGRNQEAIAALLEAIRVEPSYAEAHDNLATALSRQGDTDGAIRAYEQALRADPDFARAHNNLGVLLTNVGRTAEAIEHFREALRIEPTYDSARANLQNALERRNRRQYDRSWRRTN